MGVEEARGEFGADAIKALFVVRLSLELRMRAACQQRRSSFVVFLCFGFSDQVVDRVNGAQLHRLLLVVHGVCECVSVR